MKCRNNVVRKQSTEIYAISFFFSFSLAYLPLRGNPLIDYVINSNALIVANAIVLEVDVIDIGTNPMFLISVNT